MVAVTNVTAAVMVLMAPGGRVPKDRSWKAAKVMMAKVDAFLDSLVNFNKENVHENCLKAIQPYLQDPEFQPELVASKSYSAAGLCSWVINIVRFYQVYCEVEPKRQALSKANAELAAAQDKLTTIKAKINVSDRPVLIQFSASTILERSIFLSVCLSSVGWSVMTDQKQHHMMKIKRKGQTCDTTRPTRGQ